MACFAGLRVALMLWLAALPPPLRAAETGEIYRATVIVTGEREETRYPGIGECFALMMQKVSGNPDIAVSPGFGKIAERARAFVWSYTYHDRLFGRPLGDEQGTRDRPFDLTVQFEQRMVDDALAGLGTRPWPEPRPKLAVVVGVRDMVRDYVLSDGQQLGAGMRDAFGDASRRFAVAVVFPSAAEVGEASVSYGGIAQPDAARLAGLAHRLGADHVLAGRLEWVAAEHGWRGRWALADLPGAPAWQISGVNFDAAFRNALGGAAKILSGRDAK
jgi:hypothetical protein